MFTVQVDGPIRIRQGTRPYTTPKVLEEDCERKASGVS